MDETMSVGLQEELIADLTLELSEDETFSESKLKQKVINAIREVRKVRRYPSHYTEEKISIDLNDYYTNIRNIALYDYGKIGADFEESHNENSTNRSWVKRETLFSGIIPLAK